MDELRHAIMDVTRQITGFQPWGSIANSLARNMHDWMISKKRLLGSPPCPSGNCAACGNYESLRRAELAARAVEAGRRFRDTPRTDPT